MASVRMVTGFGSGLNNATATAPSASGLTITRGSLSSGRPCTTSGSWSTAITSRLVRMARVCSSSSARRCPPTAGRPASPTVRSARAARYRSGRVAAARVTSWDALVANEPHAMPTTSMSGSFTCAGPLRGATGPAAVNAWLTPARPSDHRPASPQAGTRSHGVAADVGDVGPVVLRTRRRGHRSCSG